MIPPSELWIGVIVLPIAAAAIFFAIPVADSLRDRFLRAVVIFGLALLVITETLSVFRAVARGPLVIAWLLVIGTAILLAARRRTFRLTIPPFPRDPVIVLCAAGISTILALTGVTAAFSPPNSSDAMAYHLPRVVYWAEQSGISFFPTAYLVQVMLQPLAEYLMLHSVAVETARLPAISQRPVPGAQAFNAAA